MSQESSSPNRSDFSGLRQIWPQNDTDRVIRADIVLVHGLAGGTVSSFKHSDGSFWPDWLSSDLPNVRIFGFGYDANDVYIESNEGNKYNSGRVFTFAEKLCVALRDARVQGSPPITFIGHGVGGIVVKAALTYSNARKLLFGEIVQNTHHVMFLDTPHRGCDLSSWQAIYGGKGSEHAQSQFGLWSIVLADLSRTFIEIGNRIHITSCYANEPTITQEGSFMLVHESSVSLDYLHETLLHLSRVSHLTMCKFSTPADINYCNIRDRLKAELSMVLSKRHNVEEEARDWQMSEIEPLEILGQPNLQLRTTKGAALLNSSSFNENSTDPKMVALSATKNDEDRILMERRKLRRKILKWLYTPKKGIDYESDLQMRAQGDESTCSWIVEKSEFIDWEATTKSRILWLHGIQGCGKSTLVSWLIKRLIKKAANVFYFYCDADNLRSGAFALGCLAHQMVAKTDTIPQNLITRYDQSTYATVASISTAKSILEEATKIYESCYICIDALDECPDRDLMIRALLSTVQNSTSLVKILCTSRDELNIQRLFKDNIDVEDLEMTTGNIQDAINTFIETSLRDSPELSEKLKDHPDTYHFVLSELQSASQGMFLLPKFMLEDLESKSTQEEILDFVTDLPSGLPSYYLRILERIDPTCHSLAKRVITWSVWARRPLSLHELGEVLSLDGSTYLSLRTDIKKALGCLISLENDCVKLSHSSVKRFFLSSRMLQNHVLYHNLLLEDGRNALAETCVYFLFTEQKTWPVAPARRYVLENREAIRLVSPFMEYASIHWISHCREASNPIVFVRPIRQFIESPRFLRWYEALATFVIHENPAFVLQIFKSWILELRLIVTDHVKHPRTGFWRADQVLEDLNQITEKLGKIWNFVQHWDRAIACFPQEIYTLAPLIDSPFRSIGHGRQNTLLTNAGDQVDVRRIYDLLDRRHLANGFDRFILSDMHVFMWQSLMPCTATDNVRGIPYDPLQPAKIELEVESIESAVTDGRYGLDPAEVGSITTSAVLRSDLRAIAIVWARHLTDKTRPLDVKSYAWRLSEDTSSYVLDRIEWTEGEHDPCRVDLTTTNTFRFSKCAVAFSDDLVTIWTPGGGYDIESGSRRPAPTIFYDAEISALTFARNASVIAGIRLDKGVELYEVATGQKLAAQEGKFSILGVSPSGNFVLILELFNTPDRENEGSVEQRICLLSRGGSFNPIWTWDPTSVGVETKTEIPSLQYFFNNGGLHAFSENEMVLVLCVPSSPDWALLAFDLSNPNIANSAWTVEYSALLLGASILSFTFCPLHERRLYILDSFGFMRTLEISRKSSAASITTLQATEVPPVLTGISFYTGSVLTAVFKKDDVQIRCWQLSNFETTSPIHNSVSLLQDMLLINSNDLILEMDSIVDCLSMSTFFQPIEWRRLALLAQNAINASVTGLQDQQQENEERTKAESEKRDVTPRVLTNITFSPLAGVGFFQSLIYYALPTVNGQPKWQLTLIMDIRSLETPKARKTGVWGFAEVGSPYEEHIASTYHSESKTLAYSASVDYYDRSDKSKGVHWYISILCICKLSLGSLVDDIEDPRGTFLMSRSYFQDDGTITSLQFSECGRYVFGVSMQWPGSVFQFDTWKAKVVRKISNPFNTNVVLPALSLSCYHGDVFALAVDGVSIVLARLPFRSNAKYEGSSIAVGPIELTKCKKLSVLWPKSPGESITVVAQDTNFLRKNGSIGGNSQWPIVVSVKEEDIRTWFPLRELDYGTKEDSVDGEEVVASTSTLQKTEVRLETKTTENEMVKPTKDGQTGFLIVLTVIACMYFSARYLNRQR